MQIVAVPGASHGYFRIGSGKHLDINPGCEQMNPHYSYAFYYGNEEYSVYTFLRETT
jgi:hypothetical protein